MKSLLVIIASILSTIIIVKVCNYNSQLGELLEMPIVCPLLFFVIWGLLFCIYQAVKVVVSFWNKKNTTQKVIEEITDNEIIDGEEFYFVANRVSNEVIDYKITDKAKSILLRAECTFCENRLQSVILYKDIKKILTMRLEHEKNKQYYSLYDNQVIVGTLVIAEKGLILNDKENEVVYTTTLEKNEEGLGAVADWLIALEFCQPFSSKEEVNVFKVKDKNKKTVGKYYADLKNLDLSQDVEAMRDQSIVILLSILIESEVKKLCKC